MELEEMQAVWSDLSDQLEKQKKLTDKMIIMMTEEQYRSKWKRIAYPEIMGGIICFGVALLILINMKTLETWYNITFGIASAIILLILPILSLKSITKMSRINFAEKSYKDTLLVYAKSKKQFQSVQKVAYYLSFILMFLILPVTSKILGDKDMFTGVKNIWPLVIFIPLGVAFLVFFSKWVHKCYNRNIVEAENLIKEIHGEE
ncbi:hypothetical protein [Aquimarina sp. 2201CG5-10]|uniref:hypothetical protein n=1 Tax=Aquimarina callyspongiae TaxID=3098150 RepID=UPI002AB41AD5|nr:hypothetical protein [Aquimarina sp. 2201CG5-10]MDY8135839.1 hypothetical protein [Aquimarina sp. 2201CG5-10]